MNRRVVVTGMSGLSPIGIEWKAVRESLQGGRSGIVRMDGWDEPDTRIHGTMAIHIYRSIGAK